ncbi:preprotein translocase subunit SecA [Nonomuraea sp. NPDC002799]
MNRLDILSLANQAIQQMGHRIITRDESYLGRQRPHFASLSNRELQSVCHDFLLGRPHTAQTRRRPLSFLARMIRRLLSTRLDSVDLVNLACGIEVFRRAPADLGPGAQLYPAQEQAAIALMQSTVIQMDTGEGKTYALLPAAFALAIRYPHVYIVCANDYLVRRDAERTRRYWEFAGITPGVAEANCDPREWSRRVVYTTISQLLFKSMLDELDDTPPDDPISFGAVLLDDADAVLLDENQDHSITRSIRAEAFDWEFAFGFCESLVEDDTIRVFRNNQTPSAALTITGEDALRNALGRQTLQAVQYLLARQAAELAYVARFVLKRGEHYAVEPDGVFPLSQVDGRIKYDWTPDWLPVLQALHGFSPDAKRVTMHRRRISTLLKQFTIRSGVSGTVSSDAVEFLLGYWMRGVAVPARVARHEGLRPDIAFFTSSAAVAYTVEAVERAIEAGRAVLVGSHSVTVAERCHQQIAAQLGEGVRVHLLTGQNASREAEILDSAGQARTVTVATQVAGRGVDIRLSAQVREAGGLALFSLGRAIQARHDRQFLGRAGRQGDPFTAQFISSLEDPLMAAAKARTEKIFSTLNIPQDGQLPINTLLGPLIRQMQSDTRWWQLRNRRFDVAMDAVDGEVGEAMSEWFRRLQEPPGDASAGNDCSQNFIAYLIERFIDTNLKAIQQNRKPLTAGQATQLAKTISAIIGYNPEVASQRTLGNNLAGRAPDQALDIITKTLSKAITSAMAINNRRLARLAELAEEEAGAAVVLTACEDELRRLADVRSSIQARIFIGHVMKAADGALVGKIVPSAQPVPSRDNDILLRLRDDGSVGADDLAQVARGVSAPADLKRLDDFAAALQHNLERARDEHRNRDGGLYDAYRKLSGRTPRQIARWSLNAAWMEVIEQRQVIIETLSRSTLAPTQHVRVLNDRILESWQRTESELAKTSLENLARCWHPDGFDKLFSMADNTVWPARKLRRHQENWRPSPVDFGNASRRDGDELIHLFMLQHQDVLRDDDHRAEVIRTLIDFKEAAPLGLLQTPEAILSGVFAWRRNQYLRRVPEQHIKADLRWIKRFLAFLREQELIGELPTPRTRLASSIKRFARNFLELQTFGPLVAATLLLGLYLLIAGARVGPGAVFPQALYLADGMISGGLLGQGALIGVVIAAIVIGNSVNSLINASPESNLRARLNLTIVALTVLTALTVDWPWRHPLSLDMLLAFAWVGAILALFAVTRAVDTSLDLWVGLQLIPPWLSATVILVFLPRLAGLAGMPIGPLGVAFGVLLAALVLHSLLNRVELAVGFRSDVGLAEPVAADLVLTGYKIKGDTAARPHILGMALALALQHLARTISEGIFSRPLDPGFGAIVSLTGYLLVLTVWVLVTIDRRCSPAAWRKQLNQSRQVLDPAYSDRTLAEVMRGFRRRLTVTALVTEVALVTGACLIFFDDLIPGTYVPVALPLAVAAAVLAEQGRLTVTQLYALLFLRAPVIPTPIDLPAEDEEEELGGKLSVVFRLLRRRLTRFFAALIIFVTICSGIADAAEIWDAVTGWFT